MAMSKKKLVALLKSIEKPRLVSEEDPLNDSIVRIIAPEGAYFVEYDEYPIDGPYEIPDDEFDEALNIFEQGEDSEGYIEAPEGHMEMVESGCEPGIPYYRYNSLARGERSVFNDDLQELEEMLIEDVMDSIDETPWEEMTVAELKEWQILLADIDS